MSETLIPHANFRWVWRNVPSPTYGPDVCTREKVLQQAFSRPDSHTLLWRDVPIFDTNTTPTEDGDG